jgi:DNA-binding NarL/FixJ family response regulator
VADVSRFTDALRAVAAGGAVLDPEVVAHMVGRRRRTGLLDGLSERDRDVLAQIAAGASNRAIARRLFLSERAVERHVTTIFEKLGLAPSPHVHRRVLAALAQLRAA